MIPADDFKKIVLSIVDDNDIIQPTYKGGFIGIKNISLQPWRFEMGWFYLFSFYALEFGYIWNPSLST